MRRIQLIAAALTLVLAAIVSCKSSETPAYSGEARVTYYGNGGTTLDGATSFVDATVYAAGDSYVVDSNSFTLSGSTFSGWNTAAGGSGTAYAAGATVTLDSANLSLYAQWRSPTALEALKGLTNVVKTKNKVLADGSLQPIEEWSTSWDSTGTESFDYYAVYSYAASYPGQDKVEIYAAASADAAAAVADYLIAEYTYDRNASGDIVTATEQVSDGTSLVTTLEWEATYNAQHSYLSYIYREDGDSDGTLEVSENRICAYAADGQHYTRECFLYGEESDPVTGLRISYDPSYLNGDPTTGIIVKELMTYVSRVDQDVYDANTNTVATSNYLFSWSVGYGFINQQAYYDPDNRLSSTILYDAEKIGSAYRTVSRSDLSQGVQTAYTTYAYSEAYGDLSQKCVYDMSLGQQLKSKYAVAYSTETADGSSLLVTEASSYSYEITTASRGLAGGGRMPSFHSLAASHH